MLIERVVRESDKFQGREDLLETFCAEIYKKSYLLLGTVSNIENLKNYLNKVADSSITNVLSEKNKQQSTAHSPQLMPTVQTPPALPSAPPPIVQTGDKRHGFNTELQDLARHNIDNLEFPKKEQISSTTKDYMTNERAERENKYPRASEPQGALDSAASERTARTLGPRPDEAPRALTGDRAHLEQLYSRPGQSIRPVSVRGPGSEIRAAKAAAIVDVFKDIEDPANSVPQDILSKNAAQKIASIVYRINQKAPEKQYYRIFHLKYIKLQKQSEVAARLGITQSELSKRHLELVKLVRDNF
jgi:hypothetical protein